MTRKSVVLVALTVGLLATAPAWARHRASDDADEGTDLEGRWTRTHYEDGDARRSDAYHEIFGDEPKRATRRRSRKGKKKSAAKSAAGAAPAPAASPGGPPPGVEAPK